LDLNLTNKRVVGEMIALVAFLNLIRAIGSLKKLTKPAGGTLDT
jgi:hypothetical protein